MTDIPNRLSTALLDRYRIEEELGQGGMATVYLAHDLKHDRKVALKVLRPELAAVIGAERFLAEITTTANLQHPHILPLFDSGEADSFLFYVMPFIEGETVRDRLEREKQLPIGDAVRIATEVAAALDYAHRHNVIHRDIKPENILLHDGSALVADFGIALAASKAGGTRMTETGMSLGTPHYMSPEQAMGEREITAKSDVYALGCVLYEMLLGEPPFTGPTAQSIVAKVLSEKPAGLMARRERIPPSVEAAVLTALEKLPADRFATAAEFATALSDVHYTITVLPHATSRPSDSIRRWRQLSAALAVAVVILGIVAVIGWMRGTPPGVVRRFNITIDQYEAAYGDPEISPDGTRIVYVNAEGGLMVRSSDDLAGSPLPGSNDAWATVFSPDSRTIAFNTGFPGTIKVMPLDGGVVRTLVTDSTYGTGLAWSDDGWIYFLHGEDYGRDLMRIRPNGGAAEFIARPDTAANALFFYRPQVLPGGRKILLTVYPVSGEPNVAVLDIASGQITTIATGVAARFSPTGHLLVVRSDGTLVAARFDATSGKASGGFATMATGLYISAFATSRTLTLSDDGTLVYHLAPPSDTVVMVSREGGREAVVDRDWEGAFGQAALSPDGSLLAISVTRSGRRELWVKALASGTFTRLAAGGTQNYRPSWSPDGREVVFTSDQHGKITTYQVPADGSAQPKQLLSVGMSVDEAAYSDDGRWIVFRGGSGGGRDIYAMRVGDDGPPRAIVASPAEEFSPALSPNGRWLAYGSDETGRTEVYVRPFPDAGAARYTVSHNGGSEPMWSHSGTELFFRDGEENLVAAQIASGTAFQIVSERTLFSTREYATDNRHHHYTVSPDDRSFLFIKSPGRSGTTNQLIITLNWFEELERKVGN